MLLINKFITEINEALSNNLYFAALSLALTLPDICGRAEYPSESVTARYILWYNQFIGQYELCPCDACKEAKMPYLSEEVVYNLRNSFLHQGTPNIDISKIKDSANKVDEFTLVFEKKNEYDIYSDASSIVSSNNGDVSHRSYRVNVRRLCLIVTRAAQNYYDNNKDRFNFLYYKILTLDKCVDTLH